MGVTLQPNNTSNYFEVMPLVSDTAIIAGSMTGNKFRGKLPSHHIEGRVKIPIDFARQVSYILQPGDAVMVTDLPANKATTAYDRNFTVLAVNDPSDKTGPQIR